MALVKPVKDLDSLNKNVSLQLAIKQEYPNVYKLIQYNSKGAWAYLNAKGVVKHKKDSKRIGVTKRGNDNLKAWAEYKKAVDQYLQDINNEHRLKQAREKIANKIKDEHYRVFPRWPSVGDKSQTAFVNITTYDGYKYEDEYVAYACEGSVQVTDKRPSKYEYYAEFHGRPILKQLFINLPMLKGVELACIRSWEMATQKADKYAKKKLTKAICFDFSDDDE
mmetsp:Transcript_56284/g.68814  ORF Transcript_56284/g.68814 Transcript_56284/m.68814 type:complete len:222 (+) Transcript_56284:45-710(+)